MGVGISTKLVSNIAKSLKSLFRQYKILHDQFHLQFLISLCFAVHILTEKWLPHFILGYLNVFFNSKIAKKKKNSFID